MAQFIILGSDENDDTRIFAYLVEAESEIAATRLLDSNYRNLRAIARLTNRFEGFQYGRLRELTTTSSYTVGEFLAGL